MKKFIQIITASLVGVGLMAGVAAADSVTCGSITNTGPGSTNTITCVDENNKQVTCNNNETIVESNDQNASSGGAFTTGNTTAGGSTSGDSSNDNTVTVQLGASCAPVVATAAPTPTTPAAGGQGAGAVSTPATSAPAPAAASVASLPETGSNTVLNDTVIGVIVLGGTAAVSQLGLTAYRRFALK